MTLGQKIRTIRETKNFSQSQLARKANVSNDYLNRIELGKVSNVGLEKLESIAEALEISVSDLLPKPEFTREESNKKSTSAKHMIPIVGYANAGKGKSHIAWDDAGFPAGNGFGEIEKYQSIKDQHAYAVEIKGDSMAPYFPEGKWILSVEPSREVQNEDMVVCRLTDDDVLFKKIIFKNTNIILHSLNPVYNDMFLKKKDFVFIHRVHSAMQK